MYKKYFDDLQNVALTDQNDIKLNTLTPKTIFVKNDFCAIPSSNYVVNGK